MVYYITRGHGRGARDTDHVLSEEHSQPHEIDWQSVRILGRAQGTTERRMKEAMIIYQRHPKMNRDIGMERSSVCNSVL